ncbi:MAG: hypothetical protein MUE42_03575 [Opitutaceae bacterium]|nr:hypothetical protein [Opitutaceae bacterium]
MKSIASMKAWAPRDRPDLLLLLPPESHPPRNPDEFLMAAVATLRALVAEAEQKEVEWANRQLRDLLPEERLLPLPHNLLKDRQTAANLFLDSPYPGSRLESLLEELPEALALPPMLKSEADKEKASLTLESFISDLVV